MLFWGKTTKNGAGNYAKCTNKAKRLLKKRQSCGRNSRKKRKVIDKPKIDDKIKPECFCGGWAETIGIERKL